MKTTIAVLFTITISVKAFAQCHVYDVPNIAIGAGTCFIDEVHVDGNIISGPSGIQSSGNSYQSFSSPYIDMTQGQTHEIFVYGWNTGLYNQAIWLDVNNDSVYTSSELVGYSVNNNQVGNFYYVTIPSDAVADTVHMRVMKLQGATGWGGGNDDACYSASDGEAEDYLVIIHCGYQNFLSFDPFPVMCYADSVELFAGSPFGDVLWYANSLTPPIGSGYFFDLHLNGYTADTEVYVQNVVGGCTDAPLMSMYITFNPTPVVNILGPDTVQSCSVTTFDAGPGQPNYSWSTGDVTQTTTITSGYGGNLYCTVTNQDGCTGSDHVWVNIAPNPPATYASIQTPPGFCSNHIVDLHYDSLISPGTISWYTYPAQTFLGSGNDVYYTLPGSGTYQFIGYINSMCGPDTALLSIGIDPLASYDSLFSSMGHPDVNGTYVLCSNQGLSDLVVGGLNGTILSWEVGDTSTWNSLQLFDDDTLSFAFNMMQAGSIYFAALHLQNAQGCDSYSDTLYFTPANTLTFSFPDTSWRCSFPVTYGVGSVNYAQFDLMWNTGDTTSTITTNVPGEFALTAIDNVNGCVSSDHVYIADGSQPADPLHDTTVVCNSYAYFDISNAGYDAFDWWEYDPTWSPMGNSGSFDYTSFDNGYDTYVVVTAQNMYGCPLMDTTFVDYGGSFTFSLGPDVTTTSNPYTIVAPYGYPNYMWSPAGPNANTMQVTSTGTYTLTIDNGFGCTYTDVINITITPMSTVENPDSGIQIYPNPATDHVDISSRQQINQVRIYDAEGRLISIYNSEETEATIDVSSLDAGWYSLEISTEAGITNEQLIIQR